MIERWDCQKIETKLRRLKSLCYVAFRLLKYTEYENSNLNVFNGIDIGINILFMFFFLKKKIAYQTLLSYGNASFCCILNFPNYHWNVYDIVFISPISLFSGG